MRTFADRFICRRTFGLSLMNGGTAGLIYGFIVCAAGYGLVYASLAEMASMSVPQTFGSCACHYCLLTVRCR